MNIEVNMNKISSVEKIVSELLAEDDFYRMNTLISGQKANLSTKFLFPHVKGMENAEFISVEKNAPHPGADIITEKEFLKIAGCSKKGLQPNAGKYQEYLYSHYQEALKNNDEGYIADIFHMALEFQNNLNYVKSLAKDKVFMKKWRREFGNTPPVKIFKDEGSLRIFQIINESSD